MFIKNAGELNGCVRGAMPCKFLIGSFYPEAITVCCSIGNECCRGYCCYHLDSEDEGQIKEVTEILI
jgi:hypothetical protein